MTVIGTPAAVPRSAVSSWPVASQPGTETQPDPYPPSFDSANAARKPATVINPA